jgi:hypothetical protein
MKTASRTQPTISKLEPIMPRRGSSDATPGRVLVPTSTAQQDVLEHYGWAPPAEPDSVRISLPR